MAGGVEGLELCAGLSEEGQGSGSGQGADLGGKGRSQGCLAEGSLVTWGVGATGGCAGMGPRIERGRLEGSWVLGWGGGPRTEVTNAGRKIDFCLQRTKAEKEGV